MLAQAPTVCKITLLRSILLDAKGQPWVRTLKEYAALGVFGAVSHMSNPASANNWQPPSRRRQGSSR